MPQLLKQTEALLMPRYGCLKVFDHMWRTDWLKPLPLHRGSPWLYGNKAEAVRETLETRTLTMPSACSAATSG